MQGATPTLARRYAWKLLANVASVPIHLAMEALLPRALGPQAYGAYTFSTSLFQQLAGFLDMGTSTCFYNALSRRQGEGGLLSFYLRVALAVAGISLAAALLLQWDAVGAVLLPDVPAWMAPLAAIWAFLTWAGRVLRSANDALGVTAPSELARMAVSLPAVLLLAGLFWMDMLGIGALFAQQYLMLGAAAAAYWLVTRRAWEARFETPVLPALTADDRRRYAREFFDYSHPLFIQALLSFAMLTTERWLLQWFEGSAEQGFFALSQKVGMACFLFVSAMTPLIMRELSIAWGRSDPQAMARLIDRFAPPLYVTAAYFSCFTLTEGDVLVRIFGGAEFAAALLPVQIMALYPLHQAYGQLAGSVFHAAGRTRVLRNVAMAECVYGLGAAWILLAPPSLCGLGLGAAGLACKTVIVQIFTVNLHLWLASRFVPLHFWRNVRHQIWSLGVLLLLAFACREATLLPDADAVTSIPRFLCSGLLYTACAAAFAAWRPELLGLSRQDARELLIRFRNFLRLRQSS